MKAMLCSMKAFLILCAGVHFSVRCATLTLATLLPLLCVSLIAAVSGLHSLLPLFSCEEVCKLSLICPLIDWRNCQLATVH